MNPTPAIPEGCTTQQLADALAERIIAEGQHFAAQVRRLDDQVNELEKLGDGFTPFPRLAAEFDAAVQRMADGAGRMAEDARLFMAAAQDLKAKASDVRTLAESYSAEMRSVLGIVQRSPRG